MQLRIINAKGLGAKSLENDFCYFNFFFQTFKKMPEISLFLSFEKANISDNVKHNLADLAWFGPLKDIKYPLLLVQIDALCWVLQKGFLISNKIPQMTTSRN